MSPLAQTIEALLLKGCTRHLVDAAIQAEAKESKPSKDEIDGAYAECVDAWVKNAGEAKERIHAFHIRARRYLYQKSHSLNDFKTCLAILKDLAELEKAYEYQKKAIQKTEEEDSEVDSLLKVIHGGKNTDNGRTRKATRGRSSH